MAHHSHPYRKHKRYFTCLLKRYSARLYVACSIPLLFSQAHAVPLAHSSEGVFKKDPNHSVQTGLASWYGGTKFQFKRTAQGSTFDHNTLTAAHPTLPFGTKVIVHSLKTHRSILVTIMDRGPFTGHRIIDLSRMAAIQLGIMKRGVSPVSITVVTPVKATQADFSTLASE
ncbi:septal ring lytic transglycosylase RlpA family protein [Saccharibacter sp. 17.LH.SD]|uniref:septal ring lytic transglycosylase RlpA family protein n=1 Tax=Saccharibacter sp. 17.LH.SD TaxID=2689393 RepID=UPI001369311C|nr:septal ring lytic transglycosylase RlpA family protein [Saccharibacter sp. 17.LH.SD]MXV43845.1 septal ring lytic transglycosylase RlpA family protein [Saccharibacter sp. 17.LH.SD]